MALILMGIGPTCDVEQLKDWVFFMFLTCLKFCCKIPSHLIPQCDILLCTVTGSYIYVGNVSGDRVEIYIL